MTHTRFHTTHSYDYPLDFEYPVTAATVCRLGGDDDVPHSGLPALAVLTRFNQQNTVVYFDLINNQEVDRKPANLLQGQILGFGYQKERKEIWSCSGFAGKYRICAFYPENHDISIDFEMITRETFSQFATNGELLLLLQGDQFHLKSKNGSDLGVHTSGLRDVACACASPWGWVVYCSDRHELKFLNSFGSILGSGQAPGAGGRINDALGQGVTAIAMDLVTDKRRPPQRDSDLSGGANIGMLNSRTVDSWRPEPYIERHRIYVANQTDRKIYSGYLINGEY